MSPATSNSETLRDALRQFDRGDVAATVALLSEDVRVLFGGPEPIVGRSAVSQALDTFLATITASRHDVTCVWEDASSVAVEASVSYERQDGAVVIVPSVTVGRFDEAGLIEDYRVYADLAPLQ